MSNTLKKIRLNKIGANGILVLKNGILLYLLISIMLKIKMTLNPIKNSIEMLKNSFKNMDLFNPVKFALNANYPSYISLMTSKDAKPASTLKTAYLILLSIATTQMIQRPISVFIAIDILKCPGLVMSA